MLMNVISTLNTEPVVMDNYQKNMPNVIAGFQKNVIPELLLNNKNVNNLPAGLFEKSSINISV